MSNQCELCESDLDIVELSLKDRFVKNPDDPPEEQRTDFPKFRRYLADEHGLTTTVSKAKTHCYEHIHYSFKVDQ